MSNFTTPLTLTMLDNYRFEVAVDFDYCVGSKKSQDIIHIPIGFQTDLASVPRLFWAILPPYGRYGKAAVVHDYLYRQRRRSRKTCDLIFKEAMAVLGVSPLKIWIMYTAVRLFGKGSYSL